MKRRQLQNLGVPEGAPMEAAFRCCAAAAGAGRVRSQIKTEIERVLAEPGQYAADPLYDELAGALLAVEARVLADRPRGGGGGEPIHYRTWGTDIDAEAHKQMANACSLPVAV